MALGEYFSFILGENAFTICRYVIGFEDLAEYGKFRLLAPMFKYLDPDSDRNTD